jgi:hypothetical protein
MLGILVEVRLPDETLLLYYRVYDEVPGGEKKAHLGAVAISY